MVSIEDTLVSMVRLGITVKFTLGWSQGNDYDDIHWHAGLPTKPNGGYIGVLTAIAVWRRCTNLLRLRADQHAMERLRSKEKGLPETCIEAHIGSQWYVPSTEVTMAEVPDRAPDES